MRSKNQHHVESQHEDQTSSDSDDEVDEGERVHSRPGQDLILDAERFKASVEKPKGKSGQINCNFDLDKLKRLITQSEDDEFFHLTCHVDETLKAKIEKGTFVDLQKLLPKNRFQMLNEEQKMQFVNKNDVPYWVAADNDQLRITGVRKWEQAFRSMQLFIVRHIHTARLKSGNMFM